MVCLLLPKEGVGGRIEGAVTAGTTRDRRRMGKHHFQTPTSNLLIINQHKETTHKKHQTFYSKGCLNRENRFHLLLIPPHVENTLVSIRLKEVLPMLHLSLPIANSVDPFRSECRCPCLLTCRPASHIAGKEMNVWE